MSTTSLKLSDELKQRAVAAAEQKGVSPHAFMVQAIEQAAALLMRHHCMSDSWWRPRTVRRNRSERFVWLTFIADQVPSSQTGCQLLFRISSSRCRRRVSKYVTHCPRVAKAGLLKSRQPPCLQLPWLSVSCGGEKTRRE